jgi:hypothetical protein
MHHFCRKAGVLDKQFNINHLDIIFKAANANEMETEQNPIFGLVRFEFFESIVRIALQKFPQVKADMAVKTLIDFIRPTIDKYDLMKWNWERFWTENNEIVIKTYHVVFKRIYDLFSHKSVLDKEQNMSQADFSKFIRALGISQAYLSNRKLLAEFHKAMRI